MAPREATVSNILRFYIPLAIATVMMAGSFSIMNSAMARTATPVAALAAFAIGQTVSNLFASPTLPGRQMLLSLGDNQAGFWNGVRVMSWVLALSLAVIAALGFSPLGQWVFIDIFGAPAGLLGQITAVARICLILPFIYTLRAASQSIIMTGQRTSYMTISMAVRIGGMLVLAVWLPKSSLVEGAAVGAVVWIAGITIEAILSAVFAARVYPELPEAPVEGRAATQRESFDFIWPLILTSLLWTLSWPAVNAGLARTVNPQHTLAVFQVTWNFGWILLAVIQMNLRQAVLIFWRNSDDSQALTLLLRFTRTLGSLISGAFVIMLATGASDWLLVNVIGVEAELAVAARPVMLVIALMPFAASYLEFWTGRALRLGRTRLLGIAKGANLATMTITVFGLVAILPNIGAVAGAAAMLMGTIAELGLIAWQLSEGGVMTQYRTLIQRQDQKEMEDAAS